MGCRGISQCPPHGSQAIEGSSSIAPQAPYRIVYNSSNTTLQLPQHDIRPGSQRMSSERPRMLPEPLSWSAHRLDPQCPQISAPPLQASSSVPPSMYATGRTKQVLSSPESQSLQQYTPSQTSDQYSLSSIYFEAISPSVPSHQRYGGRGITTPFRGLEGSRSGDGWPAYNGDGTPLTLMDTSGPIVQGSSIEFHNPGAEQSNKQGPNVLSGVGSWGSPWVPGEANVSGNYYRSDGMRYSINRRSAADQREGPTVDPRLIGNPVLSESNPAGQIQGIHSQEIGWHVDQSARGIDQSLQPPYFPEVHGSFVEDANNTNTNEESSQKEGYSFDPGFYSNHRPSNPSALAPSLAHEPMNIPSSIPTNFTPPFDRGVHGQLVREFSRWCEICDLNLSSPENLRRHIRERHGGQVQFRCKLIEDGLVCSAHVKVARNRRRHVENFHPRESAKLPRKSGNHRPNDMTDEMLNGWFDKVQQ